MTIPTSTTTDNPTTHNPATTAAPGGPLAADDPRRYFGLTWAASARVATAVTPAQLDDPTPCREFTVAQLRGHLLSVGRRVAALGRGEDAFAVSDVVDEVAGGDWAAAWAEAGHEIQAAWTDDATLAATITLPWTQMSGAATLAMYVNEVSVHTWDLAVATGQSPDWDDDVLAIGFAAIQIGLPAEGRTEQFDAVRENMPSGLEDFTPPFAAAVEVPDDAPLIDRLVAWNGRTPHWAP